MCGSSLLPFSEIQFESNVWYLSSDYDTKQEENKYSYLEMNYLLCGNLSIKLIHNLLLYYLDEC